MDLDSFIKNGLIWESRLEVLNREHSEEIVELRRDRNDMEVKYNETLSARAYDEETISNLEYEKDKLVNLNEELNDKSKTDFNQMKDLQFLNHSLEHQRRIDQTKIEELTIYNNKSVYQVEALKTDNEKLILEKAIVTQSSLDKEMKFKDVVQKKNLGGKKLMKKMAKHAKEMKNLRSLKQSIDNELHDENQRHIQVEVAANNAMKQLKKLVNELEEGSQSHLNQIQDLEIINQVLLEHQKIDNDQIQNLININNELVQEKADIIALYEEEMKKTNHLQLEINNITEMDRDKETRLRAATKNKNRSDEDIKRQMTQHTREIKDLTFLNRSLNKKIQSSQQQKLDLKHELNAMYATVQETEREKVSLQFSNEELSKKVNHLKFNDATACNNIENDTRKGNFSQQWLF